MLLKRRKIRQIITHLKNGQFLHASCHLVGISPNTLWCWSHKEQKFSKYYHTRLEILLSRTQELAEQKRITIVESTHFGKLKDGTAKAVDYIFYLCNRDPKRWKNVKDALVTLDQSNHLHLTKHIQNLALNEMKDTDLDSALEGILNRRKSAAVND